jgi:oligopeptide transport system substrate-binding protein
VGRTKWAGVLAVVALLCGLLASGCSSQIGEPGVITANGTEPQNPLLPANTNENGGSRIVDRLFAGLRWIDAKGGQHNEVARSIESTDQQHFTITLQPGWTFTDGTPVTARSFVDAWNFGAFGPNAQLLSFAYAPIVGFDDVQASPPRARTMSGLHVIDDLTFTVELKVPTIDFLARLAYSAFYPLPAAAFQNMTAFGQHPIGDGPYRMAGPDAWQHNVRLDLVRNDSYHGGRPAKNKKLSFIFYSSLDTAYSDLQTGNLDLLDVIPDSALTVFRRDLGSDAITQPAAYSQWIGFQPNVPHFAGEEGRLRRQAISMAIDRAKIATAIFHGAEVPAQDFTASVLPGFTPDVPGNDVLTYHPARARSLWAQADALSKWTGPLQIAYNADGGHQAFIDAVANSVKNALGIQAEGAPYPTFPQERDAIVHRTVGKPFRLGWQGDYPSMLEYLEPNFVTGSSTNDSEYSDPQFDQLIAAAESAPGEQQSYQLITQAQTILLHDLPVIPIFYANAAAGHSDQVRNVTLNWARLFDFENVEKVGD